MSTSGVQRRMRWHTTLLIAAAFALPCGCAPALRSGPSAGGQQAVRAEDSPSQSASGSPVRVEELMSSLDSSDAEERAWAAIQLGSIFGDNAAPAAPRLVRMLSDEAPTHVLADLGSGLFEIVNPGVAAALSLVLIGRPAVQPLIDAIDDPSVGEPAMVVLGRITGQDFGTDRMRWKTWWSTTGNR